MKSYEEINLDNYEIEDLTLSSSSSSNQAIKSLNNLEQTFTELNSYHQILFIGLYSIVFFFSLFGNIIILLTIYKTRKITVNNRFLVNIAVSNLLYTLNAPFPFIIEISENKGEWIFFEILCPILPFMKKLAVNLNTLTLTVSSVERFVAITCPLKTKLTKKSCFIIIGLIWMFSVTFALPWAILMKIQSIELFTLETEDNDIDDTLKKTYKSCIPSDNYILIIRVYFFVLNLIQYVLPVLALTITYSIITYYLRFVNAKNLKSDENRPNNKVRKKNEKKVIFTLLNIILLIKTI